MSKHPPNFREIETNNCVKCIHCRGEKLHSSVCSKHNDYILNDIPTIYVCDDFLDEYAMADTND